MGTLGIKCPKLAKKRGLQATVRGSPASWGVGEEGQASVWGISGEHQRGREKKMTDGMVAGKRERRENGRERREERGTRGRSEERRVCVLRVLEGSLR